MYMYTDVYIYIYIYSNYFSFIKTTWACSEANPVKVAKCHWQKQNSLKPEFVLPQSLAFQSC